MPLGLLASCIGALEALGLKDVACDDLGSWEDVVTFQALYDTDTAWVRRFEAFQGVSILCAQDWERPRAPSSGQHGGHE